MDIKKINELRRELLENGYSEDSTAFIVNTFSKDGKVMKSWDRLTKKICNKYQ